MPLTDPAFWSEHLRDTLTRYAEPLLRGVAGRLIRPRSQWPCEELIERCAAAADNAAVIDRRLQDLDPAGRRLLALIGHSRQPRWRLGSLLELLAALGHADGPQPVFALFEAGLLYPELPPTGPRLQSFEQWLGQSSAAGFPVFAHPHVTGRTLREDLGLPDLSSPEESSRAPQEADGLEWPLRLSVLWQQVAAGPLRRTQQGDLFKRDLDRLRADPLLNGPPADGLAEVPDAGLLVLGLAEGESVVQGSDSEWRAGSLPAAWEAGLPSTLASLWAALPRVTTWSARDGWQVENAGNLPFAAAYLLALLLVARAPEGHWVDPDDVETWLLERHPYWSGEEVRPSRRRSWVATFLLGVAYQLRLLQATRGGDDRWLVRLSPLGRWVLGLAELAPAVPAYPQTLLVQPNLEIIAYRQGLTPHLIGRLGLLAAWKTLGAACTLQLLPETVYRALEGGLNFERILQLFEQHGMRPAPPAVVEALRTWADKRERITVYPTAAIFEFASPDDLNDALARGLPGVRLSDTLALVQREADIDYRHFRLTGTRDYSLPPERCVEVEPDGVTLAVDLARSDLLLDTELQRFAEPVETLPLNGRRRYRLTPASLADGRQGGLHVRALEEWFVQRTGSPLSASARLLLTGSQSGPVGLQRQLVLSVASPEVADGLQQWPGTRSLIGERLGPTALSIAEEHVEELRERLRGLGIDVQLQIAD
jgi:hypothetical protein